MSIISELYYGNIRPGERISDMDPKKKRLVRQIDRHEEWLSAHLDDEGKEVLQKLIDCYNDMDYVIAYDRFSEGLVLGAKLIMDICCCGERDKQTVEERNILQKPAKT